MNNDELRPAGAPPEEPTVTQPVNEQALEPIVVPEVSAVPATPVAEAPVTPTPVSPTPVETPVNPFFASQPTEPQAPVAPIAPIVPGAPLGSGPVSPETPKKKRKIPLLAIIIAAAVVVLGGGTVAAYNLYYQNPAKVISDALTATIEAKSASYTGSVDVTAEDTTMKVTFDGKNNETAGAVNIAADIKSGETSVSLKGSGQFDKDGNLYFKLENLKDLLNKALSASGATIDISPFNGVIAMVDNKWIKISADDLKSYSADYSKTQTCVTDAMKSLGTDDTAKKEITTLYKNNQFLTIDKKLGSKKIDGVTSLGYAIKVDNAKSEAFGKALEGTAIYKKIKACDTTSTDSTESTVSDDASKATTTAEVWVSRFGHMPTQLTVNSTEDKDVFKATINPVFNKVGSIDAPADTTTLKAIGDEFTKESTDYFGSSEL